MDSIRRNIIWNSRGTLQELYKDSIGTPQGLLKDDYPMVHRRTPPGLCRDSTGTQ